MISVLMPVYNAEFYLADAIGSVLGQTLKEFELLIIDDGSTDGSLKIIESFAREDNRIRYISRENKGTVYTRNEAISESIGEYIAWVDADDIAITNRLAKQIDYLENNPQCVAVGSRVLLIDREGLPLTVMVDNFTHEEIDAALLAGDGIAISQPSTMIRRKAILAVGGYRTKIESAEDMDLWLRLAEIGELANLPEVLLEYRQHLSSEGYRMRKRQLYFHKLALSEAYERRGLEIPDWLHTMDTKAKTNPVSVGGHHRKWAWWALQGGHIKSARKHAAIALKKEPFEIENWRALACAVRGY